MEQADIFSAQGDELYNHSKYEEATAKFKEAYVACPESEFEARHRYKANEFKAFNMLTFKSWISNEMSTEKAAKAFEPLYRQAADETVRNAIKRNLVFVLHERGNVLQYERWFDDAIQKYNEAVDLTADDTDKLFFAKLIRNAKSRRRKDLSTKEWRSEFKKDIASQAKYVMKFCTAENVEEAQIKLDFVMRICDNFFSNFGEVSELSFD